jgi:hypothetical protein
MSRVFLTITIDCECDKGPAWRSQRPLRFTGVLDGMMRRLEPLFRVHRAKPTYLLSPEVMRDAESLEALRRLSRHATLGTHLHGEFAEPGAYEPEVTTAFQRDYPPELERQKLAYATSLFVSAFGHAPRCFRAGRFGIGPHSLGILEALGYTVESSVTPHVDWSGAGASGLSFVGAPTQPYYPDPGAPARRGASRVLEVPVTIRPPFGALRLFGRALARWLRPTRGSVPALLRVARDEIHAARHTAPLRPVVLNAMLHNVEVIPGASPYAAREVQARAILSRLSALLSFAAHEGIQVVGLDDVPEVLA